MATFLPHDYEKLVELVSNYPVLYYASVTGYKDVMRENICQNSLPTKLIIEAKNEIYNILNKFELRAAAIDCPLNPPSTDYSMHTFSPSSTVSSQEFNIIDVPLVNNLQRDKTKEPLSLSVQDDATVVTEEPQLRYWNPGRRGRSVFTTSAMSPPASTNSLNYLKIGSQLPTFCDSLPHSSLCSPTYDNYPTISQELYQTNSNSSNLYLPQPANEAVPGGLNTTLIPLETPPPLVILRQEDGMAVQVKQEPEDEYDENIMQALRDDIFTFNSIDEALDSIDSPTPDSNFSAVSLNSMQGNINNMGLTNEKHEEVVKAAKSLFSKRTRTLYHWLFPDTSKNKLKATVTAAWETLPEAEKHFYISQVLGRFGLQASSLMVNPQLGGMKCLPSESESKFDRKKSGPIEDQRAVDSLFDSCEDAGNWASYTEPKPLPVCKPKPERKRRRKHQKIQKETDVQSTEQDGEQKIRKRQRKIKKVPKEIVNFEEDPELTKELEKFRLITEAAEEDIWGDIPDPEELFAEIAF